MLPAFDSKSELHLHAYGCLTPDQIFMLAKDLWKSKKDRLAWYEEEYFKAFGVKSQWQDFWTKENGFESLKKSYLCTSKVSFLQFQAKFNLIIALFPLDPQDTQVIETVCHAHQKQGLNYCDYRVVFPMQFTNKDLGLYLHAHSQKVLAIENMYDSQFIPRLVWSLPRNNEILYTAYNKLKLWLAAHPDLAKATSGIDFCMAEEGDSPASKQEFFKLVKTEQPNLKILYHVGETFAQTCLDSAARKVFLAAKFGADRLGHAVALGFDPKIFSGQVVKEPRLSRIEHLRWLLENPEWFYDLELTESKIKNELAELFQSNEQFVDISYSSEIVHKTDKLQSILMKELAQTTHHIECCPTSNSYISHLRTVDDHPLARFVDNNLNISISSDDPGIFDTNLPKELAIAYRLLVSRNVQS